jgi:release factor glutamine methyltransferase
LKSILAKISNGEPWEYIKGECEFRGENFKVNRSTLIPRIESEQMIDILKDELKTSSAPYNGIIDVGTGSGCLIISTAKELGQIYKYYATDISQETLNTAQDNATKIVPHIDIVFQKTNLINELELDFNQNYFILANLPYIPTKQYLALDKCVKDYEPRIALDGGILGTKYCFELIEQIISKGLHATLLLEIEPSTASQFNQLNPTIITDIYDRSRFLLFRFR